MPNPRPKPKPLSLSLSLGLTLCLTPTLTLTCAMNSGATIVGLVTSSGARTSEPACVKACTTTLAAWASCMKLASASGDALPAQ